MPTPEQTRAIQEWRTAKGLLETAKADESRLRDAAIKACFPTVEEGVNRIELGAGYFLKCTGRLDYKLDKDATDAALDAIEKSGNEGAFIAARLVKWKPELSVSEYKGLDPSNPTQAQIRAAINKVLTIKPGLPALELEEPKSNGK